jgi:uncharacterized protein YdhG (YjbR/CyaY superfamily)
MAKVAPKSVDDYIDAQPEAAQKVLRRVRAVIRRAIPRVEEVISYQIPAYKLPAGTVIFFAGWKRHYALYPVSESLVATLEKKPVPYVFSKGTMRLPLDKPVPAELIARIVKHRAKEIAGHRTKAAAARKR